MSKKSALQHEINVASVLGTIREDVFKGLQKAEVHPELARIIMRMHDTHKQLDNRLMEITRAQVDIAKLLERLVSNSVAMQEAFAHLTNAGKSQFDALYQPGEDDA